MVVIDKVSIPPHTFSFKVAFFESLIPDIIFFVVFSIYLASQYTAYRRREKSIEQRINILMIKNFELKIPDDE